MVTRKIIVRTTTSNGNTYIEMMIYLIILINIFVLLTQMFYNIYNNENNEFDSNVLVYETALTRIERDLKEAENIVVSNSSLKYSRNNQSYQYYVIGNCFALKINLTQTILYIYNIKSVRFSLNKNLLSVTFIDINNLTYESKIILSKQY